MTVAAFVGLLALLVRWLGHNGAVLAVIVFVLLSNALFYRDTARFRGLHLAPSLRALRSRTVNGI